MALEISLGRGFCTPRPSGNLRGVGGSIFQYTPPLSSVRIQYITELLVMIYFSLSYLNFKSTIMRYQILVKYVIKYATMRYLIVVIYIMKFRTLRYNVFFCNLINMIHPIFPKCPTPPPLPPFWEPLFPKKNVWFILPFRSFGAFLVFTKMFTFW